VGRRRGNERFDSPRPSNVAHRLRVSWSRAKGRHRFYPATVVHHVCSHDEREPAELFLDALSGRQRRQSRSSPKLTTPRPTTGLHGHGTPSRARRIRQRRLVFIQRMHSAKRGGRQWISTFTTTTECEHVTLRTRRSLPYVPYARSHFCS